MDFKVSVLLLSQHQLLIDFVEKGPKDVSQTEVHLVLSAGGVKTLSYLGVLSTLQQNGVTLKSLSACSGGALIGALICAGKPAEEIQDLVEKIDMTANLARKNLPGFLAPLALFKWPFAKFKRPKVAELFVKVLGEDPKFSDLEVPFATAGVDLVAQRLLVYSSKTHPDMRVSEAVTVATSVPGMYPPYEPEGRIVVDGAIASECPVWLVSEQEVVLVFSLS